MLRPTFIAEIFSAGMAKHFLKKSLDHDCALTEYCLQAFPNSTIFLPMIPRLILLPHLLKFAMITSMAHASSSAQVIAGNVSDALARNTSGPADGICL